MSQQAWLIRAGRAGEREQWALSTGVSGGGFHEVADLSAAASREAVLQAVRTAFPGAKDGKVHNFAAQLWALRSRIKTGDLVIMPLKNSPFLAMGQIVGEYEYLDVEDAALRHVRAVEWTVTDVPRAAVKQDLLYSLGAFLTICELKRNDAAYRLGQVARTGTDPGARVRTTPGAKTVPGSAVDADDVEVADTGGSHIDIEQYAFDRLTSHVIETFAGYRMQELVAAVLEADGFTCKVPPEGPDQGVDVLAGSGPLGLDVPRLVVQVKSEAGPVGAPVVQQMLGAMSHHQAQQGLLVAWGGLTKPAEQQLATQYFRVRVWNSKDLLEAVFRTYPRLPEEIRNDLPLKQVWALVEEPG
ncbi:restriction endonuclease [Promicromonospora sp. CA-289599]|uniref:restriction endonuclease n=1 Tax=Promicromonospora sp. CA-289599 TaxID=3240014 RepID=UPI003D8CF279